MSTIPYHFDDPQHTENVLPEAPATEPVAPPEIDPVEEAAMRFTKLLPYVKKFGATMSAKGLTRILHAVAEFPLGANKPKLVNETERQLFHVIQELNGCKNTVISDIIKKNMELEKTKQTALANAEQTEAIIASPETEVKNG